MRTSEPVQTLSTKELAQDLGVSIQYVNRLALAGVIPVASDHVGGRPERRYDPDEVAEALARILCTNPEHPTQETP